MFAIYTTQSDKLSEEQTVRSRQLPSAPPSRNCVGALTLGTTVIAKWSNEHFRSATELCFNSRQRDSLLSWCAICAVCRWYSDNQQLPEEHSDTLVISRISRQFNGQTVSCQAYNTVGSVTQSFVVQMRCKQCLCVNCCFRTPGSFRCCLCV